MNKEQRYFNFPIVLLEGFLGNDRDVLDNIFDYSIYVKTEDYKNKEGFEWTVNEYETKAVDIACAYFGVTVGNKERTYKNGMALYDSIDLKTPKTRINITVWFDFYNNITTKSKEDKLYLLAHLALLSTNKGKPYTKVSKDYLYSRMDGKVKSLSGLFKDEALTFPDPRIKELLSKEMQKFFTRRQWDKIRKSMVRDWKWTIPKKRPVMNHKGVLEIKGIRGVNYFSQLDEKSFYKVLITEEQNKYEKMKKKELILDDLVLNHNQKNVHQNVQV